jgi:hypothetical protein
VSNVVAFPLAEGNKHVREAVDILGKNGRTEDAKGLAEVFNHIITMERDLGKAISELTAMRQELNGLREEQKHPIKTMLHKAADSIMAKLKSAYQQILAMKDKFIGGCKQAVEAVKDNGIVSVNAIVGGLNVKGDLERMRASIAAAIAVSEKKIAGLDAAAAEYHSAGRAIKNLGRALLGKEAIPDIKPNGKLASLLQAPFRMQMNSLKRSLARTDKALTCVAKLEKAAELRTERDRPSVRDEIKRHKEEKAQAKPDIAPPKKVKEAGQEL